ncbi:MAG TPA: aminoglycoside phosphotransferase family protein [Rhizomicrobium sp.]|nr:aminoglycoside phosphotransferase family protein [Rhizomicrobium sp.]
MKSIVTAQCLTHIDRMDDAIATALRKMGLGEPLAIEPLAGGVSCDVFAVDLPGRRICVKRALPKLRVQADWSAPQERSHAEAQWLRLVSGMDARLVPKVLGEDRERHIFAMEYLEPRRFPVWKSLLAEGCADPAFAGGVGASLARIHALTAGRADIAADFDNRAQFHALRIEPYFLHTAGRHPDVAQAILDLARGVEASAIALMHGDISPKNILCGPDGPVFLDAETASYGDPAFDIAFCLNHLLLKGVWHPSNAGPLAESFLALWRAYLDGADWEPRAALRQRTALLLPALLLARMDGKSPVEYLAGDEKKKEFVRRQAKPLLEARSPDLEAVADGWTSALAALD